VRVYVGATRRRILYNVEEELLCVNSAYFRAELQGNRHAVEGECPICMDSLVPGETDITFCTSCGGNLHLDCIETYHASDSWHPKNAGPCPLCRAEWVPSKVKPLKVSRCTTFDRTAFKTYVEWLHERHIPVEEDEEGHIKFVDLVKAYKLGSLVEDTNFRKAVLSSIMETVHDRARYPDPNAINELYEGPRSNRALKCFLVDVYATCAPHDWFEVDAPYCQRFLSDLTSALMKRREVDNSFDLEEMQRVYTTLEDEPTASS
jgi:hypothetical protein